MAALSSCCRKRAVLGCYEGNSKSDTDEVKSKGQSRTEGRQMISWKSDKVKDLQEDISVSNVSNR